MECDEPPPLSTFTGPSQFMFVEGLMPFSMASARVNALNVEPTGLPLELVAMLNWSPFQ